MRHSEITLKITACLAAAALTVVTPVRVFAAGNDNILMGSGQNAYMSASADETLYLNADYYGSITGAGIVKRIYFGSEPGYTDYGDYMSVTDMSGESELEFSDGVLYIPAPESGNPVYFEGEMDPDTLTLPFTSVITYKLNGVVTPAEDIGGASGLIEIDIDIYPDSGASEYMRDNFILMAALPVSGSGFYSIDAPGAQRSSLGEYSALIFESLPGQEAHFVARLGTDCFETSGVILIMSPVTVSDLENVKDIKELKDKFRDNTDAMLDDIEALMDTITGMTEELQKTNLALNELKEGKDKLHDNSDDIFSANDNALNSLHSLSETLTPLDTSLKTAAWLVYDINENMNTLDQDLLDTSTKMKTLSSRLKSLGSALDGVDTISETELKKELNEILSELEDLEGRISFGDSDPEDLEESIASLGEIYDLIYYEGLEDYIDPDELDSVISASGDLESLISVLGEIQDGVGGIFGSSRLEDLVRGITALSEDIEDISRYSGAVSFQTARVLTSLRTLTGDLDSIVVTLNNYYDDIQAAVTNADNALLAIQKTTDDTADALARINATIRSAGADFNAAADLGIEAGTGAIDNSYEMINNISDIKISGADLRKSVNDELDRMEEENNFLNMDPYAAKESLTSDKNREPDSVSIILRTQEIAAPDNEAKVILDAEDAEARSTVLDRIAAVFIKIYSAIKGFFGGLA